MENQIQNPKVNLSISVKKPLSKILKVALITETQGLDDNQLDHARKLLEYLNQHPPITDLTGLTRLDMMESGKFLTTNLKKNFEAVFGLEGNAYNFGNIRTQFLLAAETIIALKLNDDESFAIGLVERITSRVSNGVSVLILRKEGTRDLSLPLLSLHHLHKRCLIETGNFETFEDVRLI
jgi:hypothetical protein